MAHITVSDLMTDRVFSVQERDDLGTAYDLMDALQIRHLPVTNEDGGLVGVLSQRDLLRTGLFSDASVTVSARRQLLSERRVQEILITDPVCVSPDEDIQEAAQALLEGKLGCLPVVEGETLVGILTESDFVDFVARHVEDMIEQPSYRRTDIRRAVDVRDSLTGSSPTRETGT